VPYKYEYTGDIPRDFPTLGLREVKKGDVIESEESLHNMPFLKEIKEKPAQKGSDS
jgi:hypothetical protein